MYGKSALENIHKFPSRKQALHMCGFTYVFLMYRIAGVHLHRDAVTTTFDLRTQQSNNLLTCMQANLTWDAIEALVTS